MRCYALRDDQWDRIKDILPGREGTAGSTAKERFGDFKVIHTRHCRWSKKGVWEDIFKLLSQDADNEYSMVDSTIVRAHQHSAGAKKNTLKKIRPL